MSNEIEPRTPAEQVVLLSTAPDARDVTAELAAPPRRRLPWPTLVLAGAVLATAAFAGGVWYQQGHGSTGSGKSAAAGQQPRAAASGFGGGQNGTRRGGQGAGQGAGQGGGQGGGQGAQGGFTRGTVKAVDGTTVYLTDANGNTVKVTTGDATKVQLNKEGKVTDLQPGQSVTVVGTPGADGGYAATQLVEGAAGFGAGGAGGFGGGAGGRGTQNQTQKPPS
ncbi:hypothetical protein ACFWA9_10970 [Kitasatospora sp. NPDC059973]|uniref:hypothetical protein n=1 Tax=Kitasatospora sp. NPDC059973 TaxID=3347020 RepID=UPI0036A6D25E